MNFIGIDLSLRSTGLCCISDNKTYFSLIKTPELQNEELLWFIWNELNKFIIQFEKPMIALEGLSYDSVSKAKDLIYGNFWMQRAMLYTLYDKVSIVTVKEWRNPLFSKEENKALALAKKQLKIFKDTNKELSRSDKIQFHKDNSDLYLNADIKYLTYNKLPYDIKSQIDCICEDKSKYDLTDAYFLTKHLEGKYI